MDFNSHKGFSLLDGGRMPSGPTDCYLTKIAYQPTPDLYATVGFALFEAKDEPRRTAIRFAPRLELIDSMHTALGGKIWETVLGDAQPKIRSMIANASGRDPVLFPQNFDLPRDLRTFPLMSLQVDDFEREVEELSNTIFRPLTLWAESNNWQQPKTFGVNYLRQKMRTAFGRLLRRPGIEKHIPVGRFFPVERQMEIYLAYKDLQNKVYHMLQPVSVLKTRRNAALLARDWPQIRDGIQNEFQLRCELSAIVENSDLTSKSRTASCQSLEDAGITVEPVSSLSDIVRRAELALRFA